jgi:hypothetical protein
MVPQPDRIKPERVHFLAHMQKGATTYAVTARPGDPLFQRRQCVTDAAAYRVPRDDKWQIAAAAQALFFTSLTLEKVMPSARSLV